MKNSEYWRGRFSLLERSTYKTAQATLREIEALYRQALYQTRKELDSWCARFADDNGVSLTKARRLLSTKELEEFRWDVAKYIETAQKAGLDETWQRQLRNASARVHISRLEAVETQIRQQIEELYAGQKARLTEAVRRAADDAYTGTLQEAAKGLDVNFKTVSLDKTQLDALTSKAWTTDDRTFRDRCWTNKNALVQAVHKGLTQGLLRGDSPAQLTDAIAKQFDVDRYKAGRLVYTETAYYSALAEKQGFKDLGVEKVEIIGTLDGSTCSICGQLDGKEIPLAQYEPGVTVPPFHPRCRCTTAPVIPEDFADGLRIARDEDGEEYYLPAGTKWTEWKSRQKPDTSTFQSLNLEPEPVTMQAVAKIKAFDCDTLDAAKQRQLQNAHKRLLMEASKQPLGVEVGRVFDLNMQPLTQTLAGSPEGHTVGLPDFQNDYIATHTHPDSNIFSPKDLQSFVHRPHLKLLTAVGHDSTIYAIEKTSTFDRSAADILVTDLGISADEIAAMFHQEELSYEEAVQSLNFIVRNCISELVGYGLNFYELQ
ncbi:minor capsid protein [Faecalibacterium prausnitzii]|uniref:minor capsid protein n=1 Tax=Faecalibacterium prausnitzii TaxID=853 RepID=UPI0032B4DB29